MTNKIYHPLIIQVEADQRYSWCSCGYSNAMPLCDHSHREKSTKKSVKFFAEITGPLALCGCSETSTPPYCDAIQCKDKEAT